VNLYFNYSGNTNCIDWSGSADNTFMDMAWSYQTCTDIPMPSCSTGVNDMFEPSPWNYTVYSDGCYLTWNVRPDADFVPREYGGPSFAFASNIIFSNGDLDPWSGAGIETNESATCPAIVITNGAHHLDLRAFNPKDTSYVIAARTQEMAIIRGWLTDFYTYSKIPAIKKQSIMRRIGLRSRSKQLPRHLL